MTLSQRPRPLPNGPRTCTHAPPATPIQQARGQDRTGVSEETGQRRCTDTAVLRVPCTAVRACASLFWHTRNACRGGCRGDQRTPARGAGCGMETQVSMDTDAIL
eukprot:2205639-Prymnesium_polylepis.1